MKIMLLTNSQGSHSDIYNSYPHISQKILSNFEWHFMIMSGFSIISFNEYVVNILTIKPQLVVIQIGIVEAAKRILSEKEKRFLKYLPFGNFITKFLHTHRDRVIRLRHRFGWDTRQFTIKMFETELEKFTTTLQTQGIKWIFVEIPCFPPSHERGKFPFINEDVLIFNKVLQKFGSVQVLDTDDVLDGFYVPNEVHFTNAGHRVFAEKLCSKILTFANQENLLQVGS